MIYIPYTSYLPPRDVHAVCLWDDKGPAKIHQALKEDILDFIKQAQTVSNVSEVRAFVLFNLISISCLNSHLCYL